MDRRDLLKSLTAGSAAIGLASTAAGTAAATTQPKRALRRPATAKLFERTEG